MESEKNKQTKKQKQTNSKNGSINTENKLMEAGGRRMGALRVGKMEKGKW